jgi:transcription elongation GreA/GreB family factor
MQQIKIAVYNYFFQLLEDKLSIANKALTELHNAASNETKSTAGDKHETALAMLQIEQANKNKQKDELLVQKAAMQIIDPTLTTISVVQGSLVKTKQGYFFISAALGKMKNGSYTVYAISSQSPLGQQVMGLKKGSVFSFNQTQYVIEDIC